jgi:hypothetical protein
MLALFQRMGWRGGAILCSSFCDKHNALTVTLGGSENIFESQKRFVKTETFSPRGGGKLPI